MPKSNGVRGQLHFAHGYENIGVNTCSLYSSYDVSVLLPCMLVLTLRYLRYFLLALNDHRSVTHMAQVYNYCTAQ